jgi:ribosomal protein L12E/L44/L45/RPP1/RPP2
MLLTSLIGTLFAGHAGVLLVEQACGVDAVAWVGGNVPALNGLVVGAVVLGILIQAASIPDEAAPEEKKEKKDKKPKKEKKKEADPESDAGHGHPPAHHPEPKATKAAPWWKKLRPAREAA